MDDTDTHNHEYEEDPKSSDCSEELKELGLNLDKFDDDEIDFNQ